MENLNKYNSIMARYRAGEFGSETLSVHEILERANAADLLEKLTISELDALLLKASSGGIRLLFSNLKQQRIAEAR